MKHVVLAIDLGGTKIISALVLSHGEIVAQERHLTLAEEGQALVIKRLFAAIDHLLELKDMEPSQLAGISIAAAGGIDISQGLVTSSPHLPGWHNVPLREMVRERYRVSTFLLNDASAAALGEHRFGAGRGIENLILLTIGTGIGGGIIIDGKLYQGPSGSAGEIGHMTIDLNGPKCTCGNIGCLERLVSGPVMAEEARGRLIQGEKSALLEMVAGRIEEVTAEEIGVAARKGDHLALDIITKTATYLGVGLVNLVNIFNPQMIIIGGGVGKLGELLLGPARRIVQERAFRVSAKAVRIVPAELGDAAGVLGAAAFAFAQLNRHVS